MLHAYFSLIFERISVKLGWYIGSITSINPMNFQVCTLNVMVTVIQNNSSIHPTYIFVLPFIATISQDLFNPFPWMFRPRIRLMGHPMPQLRAKADLPVGFPYRFNSSLCYELVQYINLKVKSRKYRGIFDVRKSSLMTGFGKIVSTIRAYASPKVGRNKVSGTVSVPCWHATPVGHAPWKPLVIGYMLIAISVSMS